ncbi:sensor histidine kinase [Nocardioides mangrovi]|uniref:histidine kinase n=1 Tax=Nocardioides mangrovi TaxID=2874580 RepID=A0ABS7U9M0_9ACTN|nr:HAMP domain-containing sensor histidine kinase [Nocardioides mangrovi]MBZ5737681.1 HAMP domain-containing histidine kinase [Nocardioides mangrovi]
MTRPSRTSLRLRLLVPLLVLLLVGLAGAPLLSSVVMTRHFDERAQNRLVATSRTVGGLLSGRPAVSIPEERLASVAVPGGLLLVGLDEDGDVVFEVDRRDQASAGTGEEELLAEVLGARVGEAVDPEVDGTSYAAMRTLTPGLTVDTADRGSLGVSQVVVAIDRSDDQAVVREVRRAGVAFAVVAMVVLGVLAAWTIGRGLRPLTAMVQLADDAATDGGGGGFRTATERSAPELERLGAALTGAFEARAQAEEAVRDFTLDASHELRTPLTSLSGWLDLYAQGGLADPHELERAMERMESEVGRMRLLVDELDLLARMDQGLPLELEDLRLEPVLAGIVDDARVVDPGRPIALEVTGDPDVHADRRRLEQLVGNLVGNALHHTPEGTPIEVRAESGPSAATVSVVDHGPGFATDDLERVFERFHRVESVRRESGSGLGLAIVRAIADAHGGTATASTTPGGGATVTVRLPTVSKPSGRP